MESSTSSLGAHRTHCCARHGCKYGEADCPVVLGEVKQDYPCEICEEFPRVVHTRVQYGIEVDYPELQGWRSIEKHASQEDAQAQWDEICEQWPGKRKWPQRVIKYTTTQTEEVVS